jgi:hypothetical protein
LTGELMRRAILLAGFLTFIATADSFANLDGVFLPGLDHPAIQYYTRPITDPVAQLNRRILQGEVHLKFDGEQGYLRSVLEALNIPVESQIVPFSKTSVQSYRITPKSPRTLFFNDAVTIGWVRGGFIEVAAEDPRQGVQFYTLVQRAVDTPQFKRGEGDGCMNCHESLDSVGVPGMLVRSFYTAPDGAPIRKLGYSVTDDRTPLAQRWGGWYVTGRSGSIRHMGNAVVTDPGKPDAMVTDQNFNLESLRGKFDTDAYLSPYSDIVALLVFEHQMHMTNLLTRIGWEVRFALFQEQESKKAEDQPTANPQSLESPLGDSARELVDYMLFVDEAPLGDKVQGISGFSQKFSEEGPFDSKGRSLRQFDLQHRLMRYPCSYMIYSDAFGALPPEAKAAIYKRMWEILSGKENDKRYARLSHADRQAIVDILRETDKGLPDYFRLAAH